MDRTETDTHEDLMHRLAVVNASLEDVDPEGKRETNLKERQRIMEMISRRRFDHKQLTGSDAGDLPRE